MTFEPDEFLLRYQDRWDERAKVRNKAPQPDVTTAGPEDFFPIGRQPLMSHPVVMDLPEDKIRTILIQSSYKYMNDIAMTEMDPIVESSMRIASNSFAFKFPELLRKIALTVMVDESYHALVARQYMDSVEKFTGIAPLPMPESTDLRRAVAGAKAQLPEHLHEAFDILTVCIAENTLTREIIQLLRVQPDRTPFGTSLRDHLADESHHCGFFLRLLRYYWAALEEDDRATLGRHLVPFIRTYLSTATEEAFARSILGSIGFSGEDVEEVVGEVYGGFELGTWHPMLASITDLLEGAKVTATPSVQQSFAEAGWARSPA